MMLLFQVLPGGHSITAWLVDNDHNPLDPPVEMTMQFTVTVISEFPWCEGLSLVRFQLS